MSQSRFSLVNPTRFTHGRPSLPGALPDFRIRDFNPSSKAWSQQEPLAYVDGPNAYLFSRVEPVKRVDPFGVEAV